MYRQDLSEKVSYSLEIGSNSFSDFTHKANVY